MKNIEFYTDYFPLCDFAHSSEEKRMKDDYILSKAPNRTIYKFVAFTDDTALNQTKLDMLRSQQFWVSCYDYFSDKREVLRPFNMKKVCRATGSTINQISFLLRTANEMNDISCFTYKPSPFMWEEYANHSNGFCMEFELMDTDKFFPIIYLDKNELDYTKEIIESLNAKIIDWPNIALLSTLPWVTKDPEFEKEHEIRFLTGEGYDFEDGPMGGRIFPGKKKAMGYKGLSYSFEKAGIILKNVIIGNNCDHMQEIISICNELNYPYELKVEGAM